MKESVAVSNEFIIKVAEILNPMVELFIEIIKEIDKISLKNEEEKITTKLFLCSYIDNFDETCHQIALNKDSGIAYYLRTQIELAVYMKCLYINKNVLKLLKGKNYKALAVIRLEFLKKSMPAGTKNIELELEEINKRIKENALTNGEIEKLSLRSNIEDFFNFASMNEMYTKYYRMFSRITHVNIFQNLERYSQQFGLEIKPKITYDALLIYLYSILDINSIIIELIDQVYNCNKETIAKMKLQNEKLSKYIFLTAGFIGED